MVRCVRMHWPQLKTAIRMMLADKENPELADEFWQSLPFRCVQEHGVVTGKILYCWVPMISIAPVRYSEWHSKARVGRVFYSQGTGNKVIVNYGRATEDIGAPVLGAVVKEDLDKLDPVGRRSWESTYITKEIIEVVFERQEG